MKATYGQFIVESRGLKLLEGSLSLFSLESQKAFILTSQQINILDDSLFQNNSHCTSKVTARNIAGIYFLKHIC